MQVKASSLETVVDDYVNLNLDFSNVFIDLEEGFDHTHSLFALNFVAEDSIINKKGKEVQRAKILVRVPKAYSKYLKPVSLYVTVPQLPLVVILGSKYLKLSVSRKISLIK